MNMHRIADTLCKISEHFFSTAILRLSPAVCRTCHIKIPEVLHFQLVGGFNPSEKYESQWEGLFPITGKS